MTSITRTLVASCMLLLLMQGMSFSQLKRPLRVIGRGSLIHLDTVVTMRPNAALEPYHIRLQMFTADSGQVTVFTRDSINHQRVEHIRNVIPLRDLDPLSDWVIDETTDLVEFLDINLDGFEDLFLVSAVEPVRQIVDHDTWLFDTLSGSFQFSQEFTEHVNPEDALNRADSTISTRWVGYPDPYTGGTNNYKIAGRHLILIERETIDQDTPLVPFSERVYTWKREQLIDGVLKLVGSRTMTFDQVRKWWQ